MTTFVTGGTSSIGRVLGLPALVSRLLTGKPAFPPEFFEMLASNWRFSSARAQQAFGWQPHAFLDGIRQTWADYQQMGWNLGWKPV